MVVKLIYYLSLSQNFGTYKDSEKIKILSIAPIPISFKLYNSKKACVLQCCGAGAGSCGPAIFAGAVILV